jgi:hypothetical protein
MIQRAFVNVCHMVVKSFWKIFKFHCFLLLIYLLGTCTSADKTNKR